MDNNELVKAANKVKENSYSPYSKFRVGACILSSNCNLYVGCNVESCSYGATLCAEGAAIAQMAANGDRKISKIVVTYDGEKNSDNVCYPCGICLQRMSEFADENTEIYLAVNDNIKEQYKLTELLPKGLDLSSLLQEELLCN